MNKIQIRYFQIVLILGLATSQIISSAPLAYACLFGLVAAWYFESISAQEINESLNKNFIIFFGLIMYFFAIIFFNRSSEISSYIYFVVLLLFFILFLSLQDIPVNAMGNFLLYYIISFSIVSFIFSDTFFSHKSVIIASFLLVFLLETIATFFGIQYSNYQYYFKFFLVFVTVMGTLIILSKPILYSLVASLGVALFTLLFNDLLIQLRRQTASTRDIDTQIYVHDYLISLLGAFYLTNFTSTYIGLF